MAAQPDAAPGYRSGDRSAAVPLGRPRTLGLLAPDWRGVANPQVLDILKATDPAPHRSWRQLTRSPRTVARILAGGATPARSEPRPPASAAVPEDKSGLALAWLVFLLHRDH